MLRTGFLIGFALLAVFTYFFVGAGPTPSEIAGELAWWHPRGWALHWELLSGLARLAREDSAARLLPVLVYGLPPAGLTLAGFRLFRGALARTLLFWLGLSLCLLTYYGILAERVWRFFQWRFAAVTASFAAVLAVAIFAPSLLRALHRLSRGAAAAILLAVFAVVFLASTEITGTDPNLPFQISPWPAVPVFGFLLFGYAIAAAHVAAGTGLWLGSRLARHRATLASAAAASLVGGAAVHLLLSDPGPRQVLLAGLVSALYAGVAAHLARNGLTAARASASSRILAGLLAAGMIWFSNSTAVGYQVIARNRTAPGVLVALERYRAEKGVYPEALEELAPEYLPRIPRPAMGLIRHKGERFRYTSFGESYALEFAGVQWVQCAYSPFDEGAGDEEESRGIWDDFESYGGEEQEPEAAPARIPVGEALTAEDDRLRDSLREVGLRGSWNCETEPPRLW